MLRSRKRKPPCPTSSNQDRLSTTPSKQNGDRGGEMMEHIETVIVGGGQAGLAMSYHLKQYGREHLVLEQAAQAGSVWRNERWDSFTLVTPNWAFGMPGAEHNGADRDGFMSRNQVVAYFDQYVERFQPPIQYNTRVLAVEPLDSKG